jgi:hypothetical protein
MRDPDHKIIHWSTEIPAIGSLRGKDSFPLISYAKIPLTGVLVVPAEIVPQTKDKPGYEKTPEKAYSYEICENRITIDGYFVVDAPDKRDNGKKYNATEKKRFCLAIIWQLMNDEGSLRDQISQLGTSEVPRVIRESVSVPVLAVPAMVDPVDHIIEHITGSDLPGPGIFADVALSHIINDEVDRENLESDLSELREWSTADETGDNFPAENFELKEYWPGVIQGLCKNDIPPAVPAERPCGYLPWLRVTITEESVKA